MTTAPDDDMPAAATERIAPAKTARAKKAVAKKAVAKKAVARKAVARKAVARKAVARKAPVRTPAAKKAVAEQAVVPKVPAKKAPATTAAAKKAPAARQAAAAAGNSTPGDATSPTPPPPPQPPSSEAPPPPPDPQSPVWSPPGSGSQVAPEMGDQTASPSPASPPPGPGGWAPPPGAESPGAWSPPSSAVPETVGLAVASFVLSLVSIVLILFVVPALVAVVLGFVALRKIKKHPPKKGRGLAIAGVVIGIVVALGGIAIDVGIGYAVSRTASYRDLRPGDCIHDPGGKVFRVSRQSCSEKHERQVFASVDDPAPSSAPFPGSTPIRSLADSECAGRAARMIAIPNRADLRIFFLVPSEASWRNDDNRRIICLVGNRDGSPLTGSLPGLGR